MPGIIVGVDSSDHSRHALRWAMQEAVLRHVPLTVMTVRPDPVRPATTIYWGLHTLPEISRNLDLVQKAVQEFVDKAASEIGGAQAGGTPSAGPGGPAGELGKGCRQTAK